MVKRIWLSVLTLAICFSFFKTLARPYNDSLLDLLNKLETLKINSSDYIKLKYEIDQLLVMEDIFFRNPEYDLERIANLISNSDVSLKIGRLLIKDNDPLLRIFALYSLNKTNKIDIDEIKNIALKDTNPMVRKTAFIILTSKNKEKAIETALESLKTENAKDTLKVIENILTQNIPNKYINNLKELLESSPFEAKRIVIKVLGKLNNNESKNILTNYFKKNLNNPSSKKDDEITILGDIIDTMSELDVPIDDISLPLSNFAKEVFENLRSSNYERELLIFEWLRSALKQKYLTRLDQELMNLFLKSQPENIDTCKLVCKLINKQALWAKDEFFKNPLLREEKIPWELATKSLSLLFIVKAATYCPQAAKMRDELLNNWNVLENIIKTSITEKKENQTLNPVNSIIEKLGSDLTPQTLRSLEEFAKNITTTGTPKCGSTVYAKQFYSLLLKELLRQAPIEKKEKIEKLISLVESSHKENLKEYEKALEGLSGSLYNNYALATSVIAIKAPPQEVISDMEEVVNNFNHINIPYDASIKRKEDVFPTRLHDRATAARAVPYNLALYLKTNDSKKKKLFEKNLIEALENYALHIPSLMAHVVREGTHMGSNGIAPYYYYSTIPYATSAVELLLDRVKDENTIKRLQHVKITLTKSIGAMAQKNGLFLQEGSIAERENPSEPLNDPLAIILRQLFPSTIYGSSPSYINPLAGLSLIPLIKECKGKETKKSYGILDLSTETPITLETHAEKKDKILSSSH